MQTLEDYSIIELTKLRKYFSQVLKEIHENTANNEYTKIDISRIELLEENIKFVDVFIMREFQIIKLDTTLPTFYETKEKLEERRDEMNKFNSQMY